MLKWKFSDQPLGWYYTVRRQMKLDARLLSLRLGKLYRAFFPEDRRLTLDAHDVGVRTFGMPLPGKIDSHFSADRGAKGWELDAEKLLGLLEKATPAIASSEIVDDNEISQSGIDKLLDEDEEVLEDIPDNESLEDIPNDGAEGDLSIILEQKNLLDDLMDY